MALQKDLTTPVDLGNIDKIGSSQLSVYCVFNKDTGTFEVSSLELNVLEGEVTGTGPYEFNVKLAGQVSKSASEIPANVITDLETLFDKGLVIYAAQKGYDLTP